MKRILIAVLLTMSILPARGAETPTLIERPAAQAGPTQVSVGIWIVDVSNIDSAQQNFTADIALVLHWKDPRLTHPGTGLAHYALDQIWTPRLAIANETSSVVRKLPESVEVEPDGTVVYRQRYAGAFTQPLRLQSFPFDRQTFRVQLVAVRYQAKEVEFIPDQRWIDEGLKRAGGIASSITLPDWTVEKANLHPLEYVLAPSVRYSGYALEFVASRNVEYYILKIILPLVLIVMMSWCVFWTDPTNSNTQFSVAVTSMLTLIAYRFAVDAQLPRLPYLTRLDLFFLVSTFLVFFSLIEVLVTTILENDRKKALATKIDRYCRVIVPAIFVATSIAIFARWRG
jgi:hypothetical protein